MPSAKSRPQSGPITDTYTGWAKDLYVGFLTKRFKPTVTLQNTCNPQNAHFHKPDFQKKKNYATTHLIKYFSQNVRQCRDGKP